ncbi:MAG: vitamin K epoxide reductase family protein [Chthoniobacterales bacterium]
MMTPKQLSHQLRNESGGFLEERRSVIALSLTAIGCMGLIAAYQMGLIRRLPDLPGSWMDAEKVDASDEAYEKLSTPDAFIGLGSYAVTMGLAAMGGKNRATEMPLVPLALAAKATFDAAQAAKLSYDQ